MEFYQPPLPLAAIGFDGKKILDLEMQSNGAEAATIRGYLVALLAELWYCKEGFSGKRPFGNGAWQWELYRALTVAGVIRGEFDEDGDLVWLDEDAGERAIQQAIEALCQ